MEEVAMESKIEGQWLNIGSCPACGDASFTDRGLLPVKQYQFGSVAVALPASGVSMIECKTCHLLFKTAMPTADYLSEKFEEQAGQIWHDDYDFRYERKWIEEVTGGGKVDLLDVGPSNGALLKAFSDSSGRRSGLDIILHPGLQKHLQGEFIKCLIDDEDFDWSLEPYDVITAFDVFEHVYKPVVAYRNLNTLLKRGGIAVIETGNIKSHCPVEFGANRWWYTNLFEHHVFWQPKSLAFHASRHGFEVLSIRNVRHKSWRSKSSRYKLKKALEYGLWRASPALYENLAGMLGKPSGAVIPWSPFEVDHVSVIMRKI